MKKGKQTKYTYNEVRDMLCECCQRGIPDIWCMNITNTQIYHVIAGVKIECMASDWRLLLTNKGTRNDTS